MADDPSCIRRRVIVSGLVQGVFFRDSTRRVAQRDAVAGSVRNLADGSVEVVLEGPPHAVERVVEFCRRGPHGARVDRIDVNHEQPRGVEGFRVESA
ncbi:MAG: acylphosphatase [Solirubrobacterales bacterium]